jgi:hypothetical protein
MRRSSASVVDFCRDNRLIVGRAGGGRGFGTTITLCPLLVITRAECDCIVETLSRALQALDLGRCAIACATGMKKPPSLASEPGLQELSEPQGHLQKSRECVGVERDQDGTEHRGEGADYDGGVHHLVLAVDQL